MLDNIKKELSGLSDKKQAQISQKFFKTGPGEYGEGDIFLGIRVPMQRKVAAKYADLDIAGIADLLHSEFHEYRFTALAILSARFCRAMKKERAEIFRFYLNNTAFINNWDLVDASAYHIAGSFLSDKPRKELYRLAHSEMLWERRIAIIATLAFIRFGDFVDTFALSKILLHDKEDLIQKAVGWMLRETGKKSLAGKEQLLGFLEENAPIMPRTCLRYAIERLDAMQRKRFLGKKRRRS